MIYQHPPGEEIRNTIQEFKADQRPTPGMHNKACPCCHVAKPKSNAIELRLVIVIVFAVTTAFVGLTAFQREQIDNDTASATQQQYGPGATQAAELSFPTKTPTAELYNPATQQQQQYAFVPLQSVRPGEPTLQYMAVPYNDGKGTIRLKRVVGR